ncbi:hypothetical protein GCM10010390_62220 [Streptomyces mordarskii]|uniref:Uncharacterized protein n=1 Tax=Streptomyces mordarskii TaxID=1226758 RepID=A0ABP3NR32_9ACTN
MRAIGERVVHGGGRGALDLIGIDILHGRASTFKITCGLKDPTTALDGDHFPRLARPRISLR